MGQYKDMTRINQDLSAQFWFVTQKRNNWVLSKRDFTTVIFNSVHNCFILSLLFSDSAFVGTMKYFLAGPTCV